MIVTLVNVGRNLNRIYRTAYSFGVERIELCRCSGKLEGATYSATGRVNMREVDGYEPAGTLLVETSGDVAIEDVDWSGVRRIVIGGEQTTLARSEGVFGVARIETEQRFCLTAEAACAIALHQRRIGPSWRALRYVGYGLYAGPLPRRRDLLALAMRKVKTVIDLTTRERATERWCAQTGMQYEKIPLPYTATDAEVERAVDLISSYRRTCFVHCFHGRDRTGAVVAAWQRRHA